MKTKLILAFCLLAIAPTSWGINSGDLSAYIDGFVEARMAEHGVVGTTVSIVQDGRVIFAKGYGYDDLEAKRPVEARRSLFRPGSISKTLTWTAVMQLHEQGLVDLNADIQTYLPDLELPKNFGTPITMLDLMAHQPGFEESALGHLFEGDAADVLPLLEYLQTHQPQQVHEPGTVASYSNYGSGLAGLIVAEVSGESFEDYIDQNITAPLGMSSTTFREPGLSDARLMSAELAANVSKGYIRTGVDLDSSDVVHIAQIAPAGGLFTTAHDMAIWMLAHLGDGAHNGARILQAETAQLMHSQHRSLHPQLPGMAHGFIESDVNGYRSYGHGGGTVHFLSDLVIIPELNLGIFISTNTTEAGAKVIGNFAASLVARYFPPGPNILPTLTAELDTAPYLGTYILSRRSHSTIEALNFPVVEIGPADNQGISFGLPPEAYHPVGEHLFQSVQNPDQKVAFVAGDNDAISGFYLHRPIMQGERAELMQTPSVVMGWLVAAAAVFIFVLVGAYIRRRRTGPQTSAERWAALSLYATSFAWIVALGMVAAAFTSLLQDFRLVFFNFPPAILVNGLTVTLVAVALTVVSVITLRGALTSQTWGFGRRMRHLAAVLVACITVYVLYSLNVIGYNYF